MVTANFITGLLQLPTVNLEATPVNIQEAKLVIDYKKKSTLPNGNQSKANAKSRLNAFYTSQSSPLVQSSHLVQNTNSLFGNSLRAANANANSSQSIPGTIFNSPNSNTTTGLQQSFSNTPQTAGKKSSAKKSKSKAKSSTKKPKAKKSASKRK